MTSRTAAVGNKHVSFVAWRPEWDRRPAKEVCCFLDSSAELVHGLFEGLRVLEFLADEPLHNPLVEFSRLDSVMGPYSILGKVVVSSLAKLVEDGMDVLLKVLNILSFGPNEVGTDDLMRDILGHTGIPSCIVMLRSSAIRRLARSSILSWFCYSINQLRFEAQESLRD